MARGAYFLNAAEQDALARGLVTPQRLPNPALVGKSAAQIARQVGIAAPEGTRVLIAELAGVGRDYPLSIEKLCPVLSYYVVRDWREGCERCIQILRYGGMGHTMAIHSTNEDVILQFGLKKPAFRICVNTPTTHGSIGLTTGLDPAMTLGCGGWGGNITSDNISPKHLLNIKRLAWELRPALDTHRPGSESRSESVQSQFRVDSEPIQARALPKAPGRPAPEGIPAHTLAARIDQFLASRGYRPPESAQAGPPPTAVPPAAEDSTPLEFVAESDVRDALRAGRTLLIGERTIVTPAARDLGEEKRVFVQAGWRAS